MPRLRWARESGFTLVELLVVIVILGILSAVVVFALRGAADKGMKEAKQTDERSIRTALEVYCARNNTYPRDPDYVSPTENGPKDAMDVLVDGKYLSNRSEYHTLTTGSGVFPPGNLAPEGNCPGNGPHNYKLDPTQTGTDPNCP